MTAAPLHHSNGPARIATLNPTVNCQRAARKSSSCYLVFNKKYELE